jgi:hypothetical protein
MGMADGAGLALGDIESPVSVVEVSGAVVGLLGVVTKLVRDWRKKKS